MDDDLVWQDFIKDVSKIIDNHECSSPPKTSKIRIAYGDESLLLGIPKPRIDYLPKPDRSGNSLDRNTKNKILRGRYPIDSTIDLHGSSLEEAHAKLLNFILRSFETECRLLLVVTGWGKTGGGGGVIREKFLQWLDNPILDNIVVYHSQATSQHGGLGAFYVFLKNKRTSLKY